MNTLQLRRWSEATDALTKAIDQREDALARLVKVESKVKAARRVLARYARLAEASKAKPRAEPKAEPKAPPLPSPAPASEVEAATVLPAAKPQSADPDMPEFLRRKAEGDRRDKEAAEAIRAEQEESKRVKARARIEKMKAKQGGATKRMPLTGKDAIRAIMQG